MNIIGVSLDENAEEWKKAISKDQLIWNHVSNLKGWEEPIALMYDVDQIPATYLLDSSGKIVARDLTGDLLRSKVVELLNSN